MDDPLPMIKALQTRDMFVSFFFFFEKQGYVCFVVSVFLSSFSNHKKKIFIYLFFIDHITHHIFISFIDSLDVNDFKVLMRL